MSLDVDARNLLEKLWEWSPRTPGQVSDSALFSFLSASYLHNESSKSS